MSNRRNRRAWFACVVAIFLLLFLADRWYKNHQERALLSTDSDRVPLDPSLVDVAVSIAKPAYAENCARCHGGELKGNPSLGTPNLTDDDFLYGSGKVSDIEQTIYFGIRSGNRKARNLADMPAFGRAPLAAAKYKVTPLAPAEIRDVVAYLLLIEGRSADKTAATRGQAIYTGKGNCFDCHSPYGHGDSGLGAPNLTDKIWLYGDDTEDRIFRTIEVGRHGVCPAWVDKLPAVTLRALAVYIYRQSHSTVPSAARKLP